MIVWLFYLFKQKTAYELRISDWSSDVCSSDLVCQNMKTLAADPTKTGPKPREKTMSRRPQAAAGASPADTGAVGPLGLLLLGVQSFGGRGGLPFMMSDRKSVV